MRDKERLLSEIPSLDSLLTDPVIEDCITHSNHALVVELLRETLQAARERLLAGKKQSVAPEWLIRDCRRRWRELLEPHLKRVFNCTGVILHTGLGRAPLLPEARDLLRDTAGGYTNLEFNLATGKRGQRNERVEKLLCRLAGAEAAVVVNNNAAAVYLVLNALANRRQVIVSRGQLVEIGDKFRVPDIMQRSGAKLVEVGTTNKTHLEDYTAAINERTRMILRVHTSNFRQIGFVHQPELSELAELARRDEVLLVDDLGSGAFFDLEACGLTPEPLVADSVAAGADIVTFSGDKMLGAGQAGILVGRRRWIDKLKRSPLMRVLRPDKLTLAVLETTLRAYLAGGERRQRIPVVAMLTEGREPPRERAARLAESLAEHHALQATVVETTARCGSGALPEEPLPSCAVELAMPGLSAEQLARQLRRHDQPVVGYIQDENLRLDLKAIATDELEELAAAITDCLTTSGSK